jgi:hypothetical protein
MSYGWPVKTLIEVKEVFDRLAELRGKTWTCRGQSKHYEHVKPNIDRGRETLSRVDKLTLERESIDLFRTTARFLHEGEHNALHDENIALAVMRHYGVPTRLLDWTRSPYVAAYFAVSDHDDQDGEILAFDSRLYEKKGEEQWTKWPETKTPGGVFKAQLTEFSTDNIPDWIVCMFYPEEFHRQKAQEGLYTLTALFDRDHAQRMAELLAESGSHCRYVIPKALKSELRKRLRDDHGIWRGSLFPDSAGAAGTVHMLVFNKK